MKESCVRNRVITWYPANRRERNNWKSDNSINDQGSISGSKLGIHRQHWKKKN